jgi:hypothetical protein
MLKQSTTGQNDLRNEKAASAVEIKSAQTGYDLRPETAADSLRGGQTAAEVGEASERAQNLVLGQRTVPGFSKVK